MKILRAENKTTKHKEKKTKKKTPKPAKDLKITCNPISLAAQVVFGRV